MKKTLTIWLMATVLCGIATSVTSCKDDDDDNNKSEERQQQEEAEKASKFWSVVGHLVSSDDYDADYEDKTFEPTYGTAESDGSLTRIVETNDMKTAAHRFGDIVGANIDENTPSYTYSDPEVGTLDYTRGGTADEWATVDVNIKQLPQLRKIIYRVGGEGTNSAFTGKAYYRFGDVVSRLNSDNKTEYWVCVRPAFGPENTSTSYWVCLNTVPQKNQYHVHASNEKDYYLPTGIGTNKDCMQNLAEMLYAIVDPETWYDNADKNHTDGMLWGYSGMPIFVDFKKANLQYHNKFFWKKVALAWKEKGIADKVLGINFDQLTQSINNGGINLLYNGYSWWSKTSWNCTLYQASYTNGETDNEKNMHHAEYKEIKKNMREIDFDCREMGANMNNYNKFFGFDGKYRWVVRFATGKELNGGTKPSPVSPLKGTGVKSEYNYYETYVGDWLQPGPNGKSGNPEVALDYVKPLEELKIGAILGADGKFYNSVTDAKNAYGGRDAIAIVVCLNGKKRVERNYPYNGLAIMLKPTESLPWGEFNQNCGNEVKIFNINTNTIGYIVEDNTRYYLEDELNGMYFTDYYYHGCGGQGHNHPAAKACYYYPFPNNKAYSPTFMPSAGQFILAMKGLGIEWNRDYGFGNKYWEDRDEDKEEEQLQKAKSILTNSGVGFDVDTRFMTTTKFNSDAEAVFMFNYSTINGGLFFATVNDDFPTRPFIAFTYDDGATED